MKRSSVVCVLALASGLLAASVGALTTTEARATSCVPQVSEIFELSLREVTRDGVAADDPLGFGELTELTNGYENEDVRLHDGSWEVDRDLESWYDLDTRITPTAGAQRHIDESNERRTRGFLCRGIPYRAIEPGVYLFAMDIEGNDETSVLAGAVLTIPADRRPVTVELDYESSSWTIVYDVDHAYFEGDEDGCGCQAHAPSGAPWALLGLLGLLGLRRGRRRLSP